MAPCHRRRLADDRFHVSDTANPDDRNDDIAVARIGLMGAATHDRVREQQS